VHQTPDSLKMSYAKPKRASSLPCCASDILFEETFSKVTSDAIAANEAICAYS
jgi:hypothetical protein